ncbi:MAG: DNA polymerase III subunit gamma/tau [Planctomycetota bacterium]
MAYTVLARKYRSRTFDEVIGQEPIATTLVNAIKVGRIHHGYLFTGTRGVGKTSMARILAKALNCLRADGPTTTPCGACDACRAIGEGQDVDVLEIDAASNTGVDNIRELRSNTAYRPARSRYKVYIIDEVHMLSTGAFNALLKTLEEPPEHVKFILATTEVQKVPATIQSRCQRFNFRNIGPEAIAKRLAEIVAAEGAAAEDVVIQRVARLANGSMRDALSILDQLLSVSPKKLDAKLLDEILPPAQNERILALLQHAAGGDAAAVLNELDALLSGGQGLEVFANDTIEVLRALLLVRTCGPQAALVDIPAGAQDEYVRLAQQFELSHYVQMIPMLEELRRNVRYSGAGRALAEAVVVRFARMKEWTSIEQLLRQLPSGMAGAGTVEAGRAEGGGSAAGDEKKKNLRPDVVPAPSAAETRTSPALTGARSAPPSPPVRAAANASMPDDGAPEDFAYDPLAAAGPEFAAGEAEYVAASDVERSAVATAEAESAKPPQDGIPVRRPVTGAERRRIEQDPVVRAALRLFDGVVVKVERTAPMQGVPAQARTE